MYDEPLLDIRAAAAFLNVSEMSLRRWTNAGQLPCLRVGRRRERRFRRSDLVAFLEAGRSVATVAAAVSDTHEHAYHLCGLYDTDQGRTTLAGDFLLEQFALERVCLLMADPVAATHITDYMARTRPSLPADIAEKRMIVSSHYESAAAQLQFFEDTFGPTLQAGAQSVGACGDVWGLVEASSCIEAFKLEEDVDRLIPETFPVSFLCLYDVRKFTGVEILRAVHQHHGEVRTASQAG